MEKEVKIISMCIHKGYTVDGYRLKVYIIVGENGYVCFHKLILIPKDKVEKEYDYLKFLGECLGFCLYEQKTGFKLPFLHFVTKSAIESLETNKIPFTDILM